MSGQYRHWVHTVQCGHLDTENEEVFTAAVLQLWEMLEGNANLRYATGQLERGEGGKLHAQIYTEWKKAYRVGEVTKWLPSHAERRTGSRNQARLYVTKAEGREMALAPIGEWRPDRESGGTVRPKARALQYIIKDGLTPKEIAVMDPECYFTHYRAIQELYRALFKADERLV